MKKNLVTVITLALVLVNLVLTVVLTISIVPETKKANELITKVCGAIDLDLESGSATSAENIPIEDLEVYNIEDKMTINLKKGEDGKDHFLPGMRFGSLACLTTRLVSANSAMALGMTMRLLNMSLSSQTRSLDIIVPRKMNTSARTV